jgi:hypothetical protein
VFEALRIGGALAGMTQAELHQYASPLYWTPTDLTVLLMYLQSKHLAAGAGTEGLPQR